MLHYSIPVLSMIHNTSYNLTFEKIIKYFARALQSSDHCSIIASTLVKLNTEATKYTVFEPSQAEIVQKGSKFIAMVFPLLTIEEHKRILEQVKNVHPKARHWCYAWRLGFQNDQYRISDDGEPSGTAGKPILNQIDSKSLTNVMVIVVRYFGGILLGTSGLIKAYKEVTKKCLDQAEKVAIQPMRIFEVHCDFLTAQQLLSIFKELELDILSYDLEIHPKIRFQIPVTNLENVFKKVKARLEKQHVQHITDPLEWKACKLTEILI